MALFQSGLPGPTQSAYWIRPHGLSGPSPQARCAHTASLVGGQMYIFGGWNGQKMLNDLHSLQTDSNYWTLSICLGTPPNERAGHSATAVESRIFIFGGGDGTDYLNDIHVLDTETMEWKELFVAGTSPAPRSRHTAAILGNKLFVLGGGDDSRVFNDLFILNIDTKTWSRIDFPTGAQSPSARWGHSCVVDKDKERLIVFGGRDGNQMLSDLWVLDTKSMEWSKPNCRGEQPDARAGHTAELYGRHMIVFGGGDGTGRIHNELYWLDLETWKWMKPTIALGFVPMARCAHTSIVLDDGNIIVCGGSDGQRRFKDLYILDFKKLIKAEVLARNPNQEKDKKEPRRRNRGRRAAAQNAKEQEEKSAADAASAEASAIANAATAAAAAAVSSGQTVFSLEGEAARHNACVDAYLAKNIVAFLASQDMVLYSDAFISAGVDPSTIHLLSDSDYIELGVVPLGARRRLTAAAINARDSIFTRHLSMQHTMDVNGLGTDVESNYSVSIQSQSQPPTAAAAVGSVNANANKRNINIHLGQAQAQVQTHAHTHAHAQAQMSQRQQQYPHSHSQPIALSQTLESESQSPMRLKLMPDASVEHIEPDLSGNGNGGLENDDIGAGTTPLQGIDLLSATSTVNATLHSIVQCLAQLTSAVKDQTKIIGSLGLSLNSHTTSDLGDAPSSTLSDDCEGNGNGESVGEKGKKKNVNATTATSASASASSCCPGPQQACVNVDEKKEKEKGKGKEKDEKKEKGLVGQGVPRSQSQRLPRTMSYKDAVRNR